MTYAKCDFDLYALSDRLDEVELYKVFMII
jgi:hypothetical protein